MRGEKPEHFRDDPGADREVMAAQAEDQERNRKRDNRRDQAGERNSPQRRNAEQDREREQALGAKPNIGLLADRDEAGVTGEQIPQARQCDIGVNFGEKLQVVPPNRPFCSVSATALSTSVHQ